MSVNEITSIILALGKRGKSDLSIANQEVVKYLKSIKAKVERGEFISDWEYSITVPLNDPEYKKAKRYYEIEVNEYPVNVEGARLHIKGNLQSINKIKRDNWAIIMNLNQDIPIILNSREDKRGTYTTFENKVKTLTRVFKESKKLFDILKEKEDEIVPGRKLALLFDNGYRLFTPPIFNNYIHRNSISDGVACTGDLLEK